MPRLRLSLGGRRAPDLHAAAAEGQAAIALYEWSEHAKWGRFLQDLEGELLVAHSEELARLQASAAPETPEEEPDAEYEEETP
jgi:hypothetical protein